MKKQNDKDTQDKLSRLSKSLGPLSQSSTPQRPIKNKKKNATFKTSEVIILLLITTVVSLVMGGAVVYKINSKEITKVDSDLQNFVDNYKYIINNYNGKINKEDLLNAAIQGMLGTLDKNSTYIDSTQSESFDTLLKGKYQGLGVQIYTDENGNVVIYNVFDNSPAAQAGLKQGDIITKINNSSTKGLTTAEVVKKIKNKTTTIKITYKRNNKEKTVSIDLGTVNIPSVTSTTYNKNDKKIGYISASIFASNTHVQFKEELTKLEKENINSLIIDLRSNSGGYLTTAESMISNFLDSSHIIYQIQKKDNASKYYSKGNTTKTYKIIVLVDSNSASASEVMASALKEQYGATLVGETTYGKGTVQELQDLKSGDQYKLTTKNWLTSKGTWVDGKGINPDIEISLDTKYADEPTEENDNQLQRAIDEAAK